MRAQDKSYKCAAELDADIARQIAQELNEQAGALDGTEVNPPGSDNVTLASNSYFMHVLSDTLFNRLELEEQLSGKLEDSGICVGCVSRDHLRSCSKRAEVAEYAARRP